MNRILLNKLAPGQTPTDRAWRRIAQFSGGFVAVMSILMLVAHWQSPAHDPLTASALIAAKENLLLNRKDESKKAKYRELDRQVRQGFFTKLARNQAGGWLLLGGMLVFVITARKVVASKSGPPDPSVGKPSGYAARERHRALAGVGAVGALALGALAIGAIGVKPPQLEREAASSISPGPSDEEYYANWPRFRGPDGVGVATNSQPPLSFNLDTGENIVWKSEVPLVGVNSPVIWNDRVFLTGSAKEQRALYCFDAQTGSLLWQLPVTVASDAAVEAMNIADPPGTSVPTVATDGERVYAMFSTGELIAADFSGKLIWSKNFGKPDNMYGHATSLVTWRNHLLLQFDQAEADKGKSRLIAYDGRNGNVLWQTPRPVGAAWTTPITMKVNDRDLLITVGDPFVIAYDVSDGKEIWRFGGFGTDLVPSPIVANGLVIAIDAGRQTIGIRPDGQGDVSQTHAAWTNLVYDPDICSPVAAGELYFTLGSGGNLACYQATDGKSVWEHNFEVEFQASPIRVADRLYLISHEGEMVVVKAARTFAELGRGKLNEVVSATPAVARNRLYVRGDKHLFCIGAGKVVADAR